MRVGYEGRVEWEWRDSERFRGNGEVREDGEAGDSRALDGGGEVEGNVAGKAAGGEVPAV